jgi:hypothetical protein
MPIIIDAINLDYHTPLGSVTTVRKLTDFENFMGLAASLLKVEHHGVLISAV